MRIRANSIILVRKCPKGQSDCSLAVCKKLGEEPQSVFVSSRCRSQIGTNSAPSNNRNVSSHRYGGSRGLRSRHTHGRAPSKGSRGESLTLSVSGGSRLSLASLGLLPLSSHGLLCAPAASRPTRIIQDDFEILNDICEVAFFFGQGLGDMYHSTPYRCTIQRGWSKLRRECTWKLQILLLRM